MGNLIKERRQQAGLSQQRLADLCDTVKSKISTLENGKQQLTQSWMERISNALTESGLPTVPADLLPGQSNTEYTQDDNARIYNGLHDLSNFVKTDFHSKILRDLADEYKPDKEKK